MSEFFSMCCFVWSSAPPHEKGNEGTRGSRVQRAQGHGPFHRPSSVTPGPPQGQCAPRRHILTDKMRPPQGLSTITTGSRTRKHSKALLIHTNDFCWVSSCFCSEQENKLVWPLLLSTELWRLELCILPGGYKQIDGVFFPPFKILVAHLECLLSKGCPSVVWALGMNHSGLAVTHANFSEE